MSAPISVILVEDDPLLRQSLQSYLQLVGHAVVAVGDCLSYYRALSERAFDVAVLDLGLPDQGGEVLVAYTRANTKTAIIVSTARDTLDTRVDCYQTGADLFLGKPVNTRELAAAILSLAGRRAPLVDSAPEAVALPRGSTETAWKLLARQRALALPNGEILVLSPKEYAFLSLLAESAGEPVIRARLLEHLYARDDDSAQRALEALVRRARRKIAEHHSGPCPILTHHGLGYLFAASLDAG